MKTLLLASAFAIVSASPSVAAIMTFDNLPGEFASPFLTHTENGFTFTRTAGYATKASIGDPSAPAVVSYGYNAVFDLTAAGNSFVFDGFGLFVQSNFFTLYDVVGRRGGAEIFSYSANQGGTSSRFILQGSQSTALVDRVTMTFNNYGQAQGASTVDNISSRIVVGAPGPMAVPEPATWAMMIVGFGIVGGTMRRRQTYSI